MTVRSTSRSTPLATSPCQSSSASGCTLKCRWNTKTRTLRYSPTTAARPRHVTIRRREDLDTSCSTTGKKNHWRNFPFHKKVMLFVIIHCFCDHDEDEVGITEKNQYNTNTNLKELVKRKKKRFDRTKSMNTVECSEDCQPTNLLKSGLLLFIESNLPEELGLWSPRNFEI